MGVSVPLELPDFTLFHRDPIGLTKKPDPLQRIGFCFAPPLGLEPRTP